MALKVLLYSAIHMTFCDESTATVKGLPAGLHLSPRRQQGIRQRRDFLRIEIQLPDLG
jgi:hypothetical protein